jgi:hypothetical protein
MRFKAFRHPAYQMPASFRGTGRSLASDPYGHGKCHLMSATLLTMHHDIGEYIHIRSPSEALAFSLLTARWPRLDSNAIKS